MSLSPVSGSFSGDGWKARRYWLAPLSPLSPLNRKSNEKGRV